jgi:glycine/D-amino acid oxidase-like deaminating enzyme
MRVIVVGSGIVGASCAYTASRLGAEVVMADAALPGQATAAGAGIVCPWASAQAGDPAWYALACASARHYPGLVAELAELGETEVGYRQVGALILAESPQQQADLRQQLLARRPEAPEIGEVAALTGAWTRSFLEPAGFAVAVTPQRGQIVHLSVEPADTSRWPVVLPLGSAHYLLAFDGSRVVAGATRESGAGFEHRVTAGGLAQVLGQALAVAPGLAAARHLETRVGFRPMGPDPRPLLGPVPGVDGLVVATGLGPTGLTLGPYAGAVAARAALGEPPGIDLAPFRPLRETP